jgi:hypothetical protein
MKSKYGLVAERRAPMVGERMSFQVVAEKKMEIDFMMWQIDMQSY